MDTREFIDTVRRVGQFATNDPVYTDEAILSEGTHALRDRFAAPVQQCRQGYWLHESLQGTQAGKGFYKIPANTVVQGLEKVEIDTGAGLRELRILTQGQAAGFASNPAGIPAHFTLESDQVRLWPTPNDVFALRMTFYLMPPALVLPKVVIPPANEGDDEIIIYGATKIIDLTADTISVAEDIGFEIGTKIYIQNSDGAYEVPVFNGVVTDIDDSGPIVLALEAPVDGWDRVRIGDYVSMAGYSIFPMLPEELHRPLCDYTAGIIWGSKGDREKLSGLTQKSESGINRFVEMAVSRVKTRPFVWRRTNSYLRNSIG